jgi:hypothetical protein
MAGEDILTDIGAGAVDPAELENVLLSHFSRCHSDGTDTLTYTVEDRPALELKYAKSGKPVSLRTGPAFCPPDRDNLRRKILEELLNPGPVKIGRTVMFSGVPFTGWYRFRDEFQFVPVPAGAPKPEFAAGDHPFILEVAFPSSGNPSVNNLRRGKREREIELLCGLLLVPHVFGQSRYSQFHWVYEPMVDGKLVSSFRQGGYSWDGANFQIDTFSQTETLLPLTQIEPQTYYAMQGISARQVLELPANFTNSVELVRSLSDQEHGRFLRACYWYQQSFKAWLISRSIASAALVSAIEALRPNPPEGVGLREAFVNFVDQFAPGVPVADRRSFYQLRSAISHGGKLLHSDEVAWGISLQHMTEDHDLRSLSAIVRTALINWLNTPAPRP